MTPAVVWLGPASPFQAPGWTPPLGAKVLNLQCTGDGTPTCGQIADAWADHAGEHLPSLLLAGGVDPSGIGEVMLNAFSAGGSSVKRIVMSAEDRARIPVVVLADGMYTTERTADGLAAPPEGFVRYALDALNHDKLFVATSSNTPNKSYPTGSEVLDAVRQEVELRTGRAFQTGGSLPLPVQPARLWTMDNLVFADYQARLKHGEHITVLNTPVWENLVKPFLAVRGGVAVLPPAPSPIVAEETSFWPRALALLAGVLTGYAGARYVAGRIG